MYNTTENSSTVRLLPVRERASYFKVFRAMSTYSSMIRLNHVKNCFRREIEKERSGLMCWLRVTTYRTLFVEKELLRSTTCNFSLRVRDETLFERLF